MANAHASLPIRRTSDLLIGRYSTHGGTYFLTLCEARHRLCLIREPITAEIKRSLDALHASGDVALIAAVVMPAHVHILTRLGPRLSLPRLIGKFKASTHLVLRPLGFEWQRNFYEHQLRSREAIEAFAHYLFLNPYRANLFPRAAPWPLDRRWPLWWRWGDIRFEFEVAVERDGCVPSEWLNKPTPVGVSDH